MNKRNCNTDMIITIILTIAVFSVAAVAGDSSRAFMMSYTSKLIKLVTIITIVLFFFMAGYFCCTTIQKIRRRKSKKGRKQ